MKTKNNVQKAVLRSAAVIVSFVLVSYTVSAQSFWKNLIENSSFGEIAIAMVDSKTETEKTKTDSESNTFFYFEHDVEQNLEIEDWMLNEANFSATTLQIDATVESGLELESWMLNESVFQPENEGDSVLELEAWMTSEKVWKI